MTVSGFPIVGDRVRVRPLGFPGQEWIEGCMIAPTMPHGMWMRQDDGRANYYTIKDNFIEKVEYVKPTSSVIEHNPETETFVVGPHHSLPQPGATSYSRYEGARDAARDVTNITGEKHEVYIRQTTYRKVVL